MRLLKIKPNDNLFLGSGKRFDKGESAWLHSRLMPYPSVFNGAIAALMLRLNDNRRTQYISNKQEKDDPRNFLKIGKVYLYDEENRDVYMPAPLDLFIFKRGRCSYGVFRRLDSNYVSSASRLEYFLFPQEKTSERADEMYIKRTSFYNSYMDTEDSIGFLAKGDIMASSYKVGIQKDEKKGTSKEDHLYRIDLTEFKDDRWSYLVEYSIKDDWWGSDAKGLGDGYLKLGGENKSCKYYDILPENIMYDYEKEKKVYETKNETEFVKLYFMSPVIFNHYSYMPTLVDSKVQVVGGSSSKPYYIGGFDMKKGRSKNMYRAVPEGAVYVLKSEAFKNKPLGEIKEEVSSLLEKDFKEYQRFYKEGFGRFEIIPLSHKQLKGEA